MTLQGCSQNGCKGFSEVTSVTLQGSSQNGCMGFTEVTSVTLQGSSQKGCFKGPPLTDAAAAAALQELRQQKEGREASSRTEWCRHSDSGGIQVGIVGRMWWYTGGHRGTYVVVYGWASWDVRGSTI